LAAAPLVPWLVGGSLATTGVAALAALASGLWLSRCAGAFRRMRAEAPTAA
jgi:hypothetical protein